MPATKVPNSPPMSELLCSERLLIEPSLMIIPVIGSRLVVAPLDAINTIPSVEEINTHVGSNSK